MSEFSSPLNPPNALPRRTQILIVLGLAAAVIVVFLVFTLGAKLFSGHAEPPKKPATPNSFMPTPQQLANLQVAQVNLWPFHTEVVTDGKIAVDGNTTTPVFSPYSGRVTRLIANLGDSVRQGQPLIAIEATESVQAQNDLIAAAATLETTRAQLNQAELLEKRKHALLEAKGGSLQDWQQSQSDLVVAQSAHRSADTALALVKNRLRILGKTDAEIANIETSKKIDAAASVPAPISGTVTDRQVGLGQFIQAGASNPIFAISNLSTVWLIGNVRETDAPAIHRGMPVEVKVLAYPDRVFRAKLTYVAPLVDPTTRRVTVRAQVENPDGILKPEMFASFSIFTDTDQKAPAIPDSAIIYEGNTKRVWVMNPDNSLSLRDIRTGRNSGSNYEVTGGIRAGEKIVTGGTLFIDRAAKGE
jgi:membrane fusion protein, heavy metal efflux system